MIGSTPRPKRSAAPMAISIALHVVLGMAFVVVLSIPYPIRELFRREQTGSPAVERISFLRIPDPGQVVRARGDGRPPDAASPRSRTRPPQLSAPFEPGVILPPTALPAPRAPEIANGPLVSGGGPGERIRPSFHDPRLWGAGASVASAPKSQSERLDSAIIARLHVYNDSLVIANSGRKPTDWTVDRNGKKYGIDDKNIYLGGITIPRKIGPIDLLPTFGRGTPLSPTQDRSRSIALMNSEIQQQVQRAMTDEEFKAAVKRIRERKERERQRQTVANPD